MTAPCTSRMEPVICPVVGVCPKASIWKSAQRKAVMSHWSLTTVLISQPLRRKPCAPHKFLKPGVGAEVTVQFIALRLIAQRKHRVPFVLGDSLFHPGQYVLLVIKG